MIEAKPFTAEELRDERGKVLMNDPVHDMRRRFLATIAARDKMVLDATMRADHAYKQADGYIKELAEALATISYKDDEINKLKAKLDGLMVQWDRENKSAGVLLDKLVSHRRSLEAVRYHALALWEMMPSLENVNQFWSAVEGQLQAMKHHIDNYDTLTKAREI